MTKLRQLNTLKKLRDLAPAEIRIEPKIAFGWAVQLNKLSVNENSRLEPRAKEFRLRSEFTLRRTWPEVFGRELRRVTPEACKAWLKKLENGASKSKMPLAKSITRAGNLPTTVNAASAFLRHVFAIKSEVNCCTGIGRCSFRKGAEPEAALASE